MLNIRARQKDNIIVLDVQGRIDVDAAHFVEVVGQCIRDGNHDILCNFEEVEHVDYMGLSVLLIAFKEVANHHGRMKFVNIPVHIRNMLSIAGIDKTVELYVSEERALESFKEDKTIEHIRKMQLRRRFKRLPIEMKAELRAKHGVSASGHKVEIMNLSGIGAYICGCDSFKLGDDVVLKIKLQPKQEELELDAKVVWLPEKKVQHRLHPGVGVEFQHIPGHLQQKLIEFIDRNFSFMSAE